MQLLNWQPFEHEACGWFDSALMVGVKDGFDVVIGNPPYVRQESITELKPAFQKGYPEVYVGTADLYVYFYARALQLLKVQSVVAFISSNRWMKAGYGENLRAFFLEQTKLLCLIDFKGKQLFNAVVDTNILICVKGTANNTHALQMGSDLPSTETKLTLIPQNGLNKKGFTLGDVDVQALKMKIESKGIPFIKWQGISINRGITTGLNKVFIISEQTRNDLIRQDSRSEEILKPVLKGANIKRYFITKPEQYLVFTYTGIAIEKYPAVFNYLKKFENELTEVYEAKNKLKKWFELRKCSYYDKFLEKKLVWTRLSNINAFSISNAGEFSIDSSSFAVSDSIEYLSAILNSKVVLFYFKLGSVIWGKDGIKWFGKYFDNIPIPKISKTQQQPFITLVNQILAVKRANPQADTSALEREIDRLVYALYGLTAAEVALVEGR